MVLGLVVFGMLIGAAAGCACLAAGGSWLVAIAIYGLSGAFGVAGLAAIAFVVSQRGSGAPIPGMRAAE